MILRQLPRSTQILLNHISHAERFALRTRAYSYMSRDTPGTDITSCRYANLKRCTSQQQYQSTKNGWHAQTERTSTRSLSTASIDHDFASKSYSSLLKGLEINTVPAEDDGHPLAVYTIANDDASTDTKQRTPVLLLHGRTWSSVPVYHLVGGHENNEVGTGDSRSLIEALYNTGSIQPYAMDFRGFGGTPKDDTGFVEPLRCVKDVVSVLNWIQSNIAGGADISKPALLGWSHGALIAQIAAQRHPDAMSKLVL